MRPAEIVYIILAQISLAQAQSRAKKRACKYGLIRYWTSDRIVIAVTGAFACMGVWVCMCMANCSGTSDPLPFRLSRYIFLVAINNFYLAFWRRKISWNLVGKNEDKDPSEGSVVGFTRGSTVILSSSFC